MVWRRRYSRRSYLSPTASRIKELIQLGDLDYFLNEIFSMESKYTISPKCMNEILYYTPPENKHNEKFMQYFGVALVRLLENKISTKKHKWGNDGLHNYIYPNLINKSQDCLTQESKNEIVEQILKYSRNFQSPSRKTLSHLAIEFVDNNNVLTISLLQEFYRILDTNKFNILISKTPQGLKNPDVKQILNKTHLYDYLKYSEELINSNEKEKIKLTKAIAKTPTLIKRLPFNINIEFDHLKEIAPAMRFKFMQFAFKNEIDQSRYGWKVGEQLNREVSWYKTKYKEQNLIMPFINLEQMKELLFSVCLKKNAEFVRWIKKYELYLECLIASKRVDINKYK